jgi:MFS family permease
MSSIVLGYENLLISVINSFATATAALIGAFYPKKFNNIRFLEIWMTTGTLASLMPLIVDMTNFFWISLVAFLWGVTLGFGMPASMEYLTENTTVDIRGRVGAIVLFTMFAEIFVLATTLVSLDYHLQILALGAFRFVGLVLFILLKPERTTTIKKEPSYANILREKSFLLYFSAWVMFSLVNYLNVPILNQHFGGDFAILYATIENIITAVFALMGGILCDIVGRKVVVLSGFVMLGLGYAVLGVFPWSLAGWYFYTVVDGIAWGILGAVFFMVLWGDLAYENSSKKYFALGGLPLLFSNLLQKLVGPDLASTVPVITVFSLTSFFLFLAVLPLMYAPETLPEKKIKERELKGYIEKAKKVKEKYA